MIMSEIEESGVREQMLSYEGKVREHKGKRTQDSVRGMEHAGGVFE